MINKLSFLFSILLCEKAERKHFYSLPSPMLRPLVAIAVNAMWIAF